MSNKNTYSSYSRYNITNSNLSYKSSQYSRQSQSNTKYSHQHIKKSNRKRTCRGITKSIIALCVITVIAIIVFICFPIQVKINDKQVTLTHNKTLKAAVDAAEINVNPGNLVAVDYSLIEKGKGNLYYATLNDKEISENTILYSGDEVNYCDGKDIMEDYTSIDTKIIAKSKIEGVGAIHKIEGSGDAGIWSKMTGKISGKYAERQTKDPVDVTCRQYNINPGKDKVIALTFDDGPSDEYTQDVLDILKKYDAHATFFVIGERLNEKWATSLVAREENEGHQVCTHSFDHARAVGGTDITLMSAEKQIEEVTKGKAAIAKATKNDASSVARLPGGNMTELTCRIIAPYISAEIGWNIDTGDWKKPGSDVILEHLKLASSGDIVLCHDGGGDRSETVEALSQFLKEYTNKGYKFITIDEIMEYEPAKQSQQSQTKSYY